MKHILGYARKAINDFGMIKAGDKVAVGLSGGKDSILTLITLAQLRKFYPEKFEVIAITLDMGVEGFDVTSLKKLCEEYDVEYIVEKTHIKGKKGLSLFEANLIENHILNIIKIWKRLKDLSTRHLPHSMPMAT